MTSDIYSTQHRGNPLIPWQTALARITEGVEALQRPAETVALEDALGRVLAADVVLDRPEPPVSRSAMDGFALRSADGIQNRQILATVYAGSSEIPEVGEGQAAPVMTGGSIPAGADCVVPVEFTQRVGEKLVIQSSPQKGRHIRCEGEIGEAGRQVVAAGTMLLPSDLCAAAGCGAAQVAVRPKPQLSLLSTGDEVIGWQEQPLPHQVRDSNRFGAAFQCAGFGAEITAQKSLVDDPKVLRAGLTEAMETSDLVVTIGGVSMGERDYLPGLFQELGFECWFHGVAMQPGKPVWLGKNNHTWLLGLPGNPVSAFVTLELFGRRLVSGMLGLTSTPGLQMLAARLGNAARARKRDRFLPAHLEFPEQGPMEAWVQSETGSGDWTSLAGATGLVFLSAGSDLVAGDAVKFIPFHL